MFWFSDENHTHKCEIYHFIKLSWIFHISSETRYHGVASELSIRYISDCQFDDHTLTPAMNRPKETPSLVNESMPKFVEAGSQRLPGASFYKAGLRIAW